MAGDLGDLLEGELPRLAAGAEVSCISLSPRRVSRSRRDGKSEATIHLVPGKSREVGENEFKQVLYFASSSLGCDDKGDTTTRTKYNT